MTLAKNELCEVRSASGIIPEAQSSGISSEYYWRLDSEELLKFKARLISFPFWLYILRR